METEKKILTEEELKNVTGGYMEIENVNKPQSPDVEAIRSIGENEFKG